MKANNEYYMTQSENAQIPQAGFYEIGTQVLSYK